MARAAIEIERRYLHRVGVMGKAEAAALIDRDDARFRPGYGPQLLNRKHGGLLGGFPPETCDGLTTERRLDNRLALAGRRGRTPDINE